MYDKSKRTKSQEEAPYPIPWPIPHGPHLQVPETDCNLKYSSDSEHSDMTCSWGWCIQTRRGWPASMLDTSRTQRSDKRSEPFSLAAGFMSQRETSVGIKNNVLQVSRPWERIKTVFTCSRISHHLFISTTLLDWSNQWTKSMMLRNGDFYWLIHQ